MSRPLTKIDFENYLALFAVARGALLREKIQRFPTFLPIERTYGYRITNLHQQPESTHGVITLVVALPSILTRAGADLSFTGFLSFIPDTAFLRVHITGTGLY